MMNQRDLADWRGIMTGFGILLCMGGGMLAAMFDRTPGRSGTEFAVTTAIVVAGVLGIEYGKEPARRLMEWLVVPDPARHEAFKNGATVLLCVFSFGLCVVGAILPSRFGY